MVWVHVEGVAIRVRSDEREGRLGKVNDRISAEYSHEGFIPRLSRYLTLTVEVLW